MSSAASLGFGGAQQVFAVQVLLGLDLRGVDAEQSAWRDAQVPVQARFSRDDPAQLGALVPGQCIAAGDRLLQLGDQPRPGGGVALGGFGVEADDEPLVFGDPHFLDLQVPGHVLVAALPRQRGLRFGGPGAELLPDDVVVIALPQVAAAGGGGEPAVSHPDDAGEHPVPHVVL
jgi:hypothetical protein